MGLSTIGGAFTPKILQKMAAWNKRPIIFPLSNPSSKSECTFEAAVTHTDGRALFASGSPFPPFRYKNKVYHPGQGNNMYVFPGIGLGTILSKAVKVTSGMIFASGEAIPTILTEEEKEMALLYPDITRIREVSVVVARYVIRAAQKDNVDRIHHLREINDQELDDYIRHKMYDPHAETAALEAEVQDLAKDLTLPVTGKRKAEASVDDGAPKL
jgi:malate dehydrogenase (oxaloacetate-decarboxylating)(NADP+)